MKEDAFFRFNKAVIKLKNKINVEFYRLYDKIWLDNIFNDREEILWA